MDDTNSGRNGETASGSESLPQSGERTTEAFLDTYRRLEQALKNNKRYAQNNPYENAIVRFANTHEGKPYKISLDLIREVRNLLTHSPKIDGDFPIEPSSALYEKLEEILYLVEHPEPALNYAVRSDQIFRTSLQENALNVMRTMEKAGFSHVPVVFREKLIGVFSKTCVFSYLIHNVGKTVNETLAIGDFSRYIDFAYRNGDRYEFVAKDALAADIRDMFDISLNHRGRRISAVFITENGAAESKLLGMITPWDILRKAEKSLP